MSGIRTIGGGGLRTTRDGKVLVGCLVVLGIFLLLLIGGGVIVALNWKTWAADGIHKIAVQAINDSDLSDSEKGEVIVQIERLTEGFKSGAVTLANLNEIAEKLTESPLVPAAIVYGAKSGYLDPSDLTDEEKAAGELAFARVARGMFEKSVTPEQLKDVFKPIETTNMTEPGGLHIENPKFRLHLKAPKNCTGDELREVIANAQATADAAGIPDERVELDVSDELQKVIDAALGEGALPEAPGTTEGP